MRKLLLLAALSAMAVLIVAPAAMAQSGADGSFNCPDFATQEEAQAYYDSQGGLAGGDPDGLDADDDGQACEDSLPSAGPTDDDDDELVEDEPTDDNHTSQYEQYDVPDEPTTTSTPSASTTTSVLPDTGGPSLLLPVAGLLLATGLLGLPVLRKR